MADPTIITVIADSIIRDLEYQRFMFVETVIAVSNVGLVYPIKITIILHVPW